MSCQTYKVINFKNESFVLIAIMNRIITEYVKQGYRLTARQLYYQLVARDHVENTERSYKRVTGLIDDAKSAGIMDWEAIEDRTRAFIRRTRWESGKEILQQVARSYHMDMWDNQSCRVFVIVEKEALAGVLEGVCHKYDVPLLAARGYPSGTVLREFAVSDLLDCQRWDQDAIILHLGDHDPSGIDMSRDLRERLAMFSETDTNDTRLDIHRIALNMDQIHRQKPPPNPAKSNDPRFRDYTRKHGSKSWELDALTPTFINDLVESQILDHIQQDNWDMKKELVDSVRAKIEKIAKNFKTEDRT